MREALTLQPAPMGEKPGTPHGSTPNPQTLRWQAPDTPNPVLSLSALEPSGPLTK